MIEKTNLLGAVVAILFYLSAIIIFICRLVEKPKIGYLFGVFEICLAIPLIYLIIKAPELNRPHLYYIQIALMIIWLILELLLDYIFKINFRQIRWGVISYVTLFFASTGGMLGVATYAGRGWSVVSIVLFLIMAVLAFIQRRLTGI